MSEETLLRDEAEIKEETQQVAIPNPFDESTWVDAPTEIKEEAQELKEVVEEEKQITEEVKTSNWFEDLGFTTADEAKEQFTELRKLKDVAPTKEEIKFANEQSRLFFEYVRDGKEDEALDLLSKKKQIERLTVGEVNDTNAADIVKLSMQQKYKEFSQDDIDYRFKKQFSIPKEPVQKDIEDDEDFAIRHAEWKEKAEETKRDLLIEAKIARPDLEKLKQELVLSNIGNGSDAEAQKLQSQKDLEVIAERREVYFQTLGKDYKNFNGFNAVYKSEGVEIPVSYSVEEEEKSVLKTELEDFDVEDFYVSRWFNKDGSPNVKATMEDVYFLKNRDKIIQKLVNETGVKVLDNYKQSIKNVNVKGGQPIIATSDKQHGVAQMADQFFEQGL